MFHGGQQACIRVRGGRLGGALLHIGLFHRARIARIQRRQRALVAFLRVASLFTAAGLLGGLILLIQRLPAQIAHRAPGGTEGVAFAIGNHLERVVLIGRIEGGQHAAHHQIVQRALVGRQLIQIDRLGRGQQGMVVGYLAVIKNALGNIELAVLLALHAGGQLAIGRRQRLKGLIELGHHIQG